MQDTTGMPPVHDMDHTHHETLAPYLKFIRVHPQGFGR